MFTRARIFANLTPFERALLRLIEGLILSAVVAGLQAAAPYLASGTITPAQLGGVLHTFVVATVAALFSSGLKYARAFGDPPLPVAGPNPSPALPSAFSPASPVPAVPALPTVPAADAAAPTPAQQSA